MNKKSAGEHRPFYTATHPGGIYYFIRWDLMTKQKNKTALLDTDLAM